MLCSPFVLSWLLMMIRVRLSQNISKELSLYIVQYLRRVQISQDGLAMQVLVWFCMVWLRTIWFGATHAYLR